MKFQEMVSKLVKQGEEIKAQMSADDCHLMHMAIGLAGEATELLDHIHEDVLCAADPFADGGIVEEGGDFYFYWVDLARLVGLDTGELEAYAPKIFVRKSYEGIEDEAVRLAVNAGKVLDLVKKLCIYRKTFEDLADKNKPSKNIRAELQRLLECCRMGLYAIHTARGVSTSDILKNNQTKLAKRYGDQFSYSDEAARQRADKEEGT